MALSKASLVLAALLFLKFSCGSVLKPQQKSCDKDKDNDKDKYDNKEIVFAQGETTECNKDLLAINKSKDEIEKEESIVYADNVKLKEYSTNQYVGGGDYESTSQSSGSDNKYTSQLRDTDYLAGTRKLTKFCYKQWDTTDSTTTTQATSKGVCYCKEKRDDSDIGLSDDLYANSVEGSYYDSRYTDEGSYYNEGLSEQSAYLDGEIYYAADKKEEYDSETKDIIYDSKYLVKETDTKIVIDDDSGKEGCGKGYSKDKTVITKEDSEKGQKNDNCVAEDSTKVDTTTVIICDTTVTPKEEEGKKECKDKKEDNNDKKGKPCDKGKVPKKDKDSY